MTGGIDTIGIERVLGAALPLLRVAGTRRTRDEAELGWVVPAFEGLMIRAAEAAREYASGGDESEIEPNRALRMAAEIVAVTYAEEGMAPSAADVAASMKHAVDLGAQFASSTEVPSGGDAVEAMATIAAAVSRYSFGYPVADLTAQIVSVLQEAAARMTAAMAVGGAPPQRLGRDAFGALAALYADAHRVERNFILENWPQAREPRGPISMDGVWRRFDASAGLLVTLLRQIGPAPAVPSAELVPDVQDSQADGEAVPEDTVTEGERLIAREDG